MVESVIRLILGREELGSTGIGQGVAVPHTRHPTLQGLVGTVALSRRGVDFAALDGEPVDIFFLLVSPHNQPGAHLRALENISRHLKDERFVSFLRQAKSRERVVEILEEADRMLAVTWCNPAPDRSRSPRRQLSLEENLRHRIITNHEDRKTAARVRFIPLVACPRPWPIEPPMSEDPAVARRQVEVLNALGLHLRPALKFVELALKYQAEVRVHYNGNDFNGKSILDLTSLAAELGSRLELEARARTPPKQSRR